MIVSESARHMYIFSPGTGDRGEARTGEEMGKEKRGGKGEGGGGGEKTGTMKREGY